MPSVSYHLQNGTLPEREYLLEKLSDEAMVRLTPAIVILGAVGLIGFIGNFFVLIFYSRNHRQTAFTAFIQTLCIADLAICCVAVPIEIADIRLNYTFKSAIVCKFMRYVDYAASLLSCFTLVAIAVYRYRIVCKPFEVPVSIKKARVACAILISISLVLTTPVYKIYTNMTVNVTNEFYDDLEGRDCTVDFENAFVLAVVSGSGLLLLFLVAIAILVVLYSKLGCLYYTHRTKKRKQSQNVPCAERSASSRIRRDTPGGKDDVGEAALEEGTSRHASLNVSTKSEDTQFEQERSQHILNRENVKFIILMFIISCVFIVSYLPYLIVLIWFFDSNPVADEHYGTLSTLLGRSWVLNSAVNPIIYGCFNSDLRRFIGKTILPCVY